MENAINIENFVIIILPLAIICLIPWLIVMGKYKSLTNKQNLIIPATIVLIISILILTVGTERDYHGEYGSIGNAVAVAKGMFFNILLSIGGALLALGIRPKE